MGIKIIDFGEWEPQSEHAEAVKIDSRDKWADEIIKSIAFDEDPTMQMSSGDRVVVSWVDDMDNGIVHVTIQG